MLPKHHYIPKFYLKQWACADGRLCEFSRPYKRVEPRRTHPDGTGYIRGLYTFSGLPSAAVNYLENVFLLHADDGAADVHRRLLADDVEFDGPTKSSWSRFIMSLFHRNPEAIERITTKISQDFPASLEQFRAGYETNRHESDPVTFEEFQEKLSTDRAAFERTVVMVLQRIMDSQLVGGGLNEMIWGVVRVFKSRYPLLTSDRPVVMSNGLARPEAHIVMPISPDRIFVAARKVETAREIDARGKRGELVEELNDRIVRQARRFVYSCNDAQLRFVEKRLGMKEKWSPWE
jgi:hypothetical protein